MQLHCDLTLNNSNWNHTLPKKDIAIYLDHLYHKWICNRSLSLEIMDKSWHVKSALCILQIIVNQCLLLGVFHRDLKWNHALFLYITRQYSELERTTHCILYISLTDTVEIQYSYDQETVKSGIQNGLKW